MNANSYFGGLDGISHACEEDISVEIAGQQIVANSVTGNTTQVSVVDQPTSGAAAVSPPATESTTSNLKPSALEFTPTEHSLCASTLCVNIGKPILLQTVSAVVFNPCDSTNSKRWTVAVSVPT